jgi:choline dehydrogenase-like flavoprotein
MRSVELRWETLTVIERAPEANRGKVPAPCYDYVIVGGGSAGCVIARLLLDGTDASVLLPAKRLSRDETRAFLRQSCSSYFHPVGTCAMGRGKEAVVDARLRVRGVLGLRIADASVMPSIPSANTHAPAIMIGEFASRLLLAG